MKLRLLQLTGGIVDTSTLIYLERLSLLACASQQFRLGVIPQVAAEYGAYPAGMRAMPCAGAGTTDQLVCRVARLHGLAVFSEDKHVLQQAASWHLPYYNTLMLVLALCVQGVLSRRRYMELIEQLKGFARYSPQIFSYGQELFTGLLTPGA